MIAPPARFVERMAGALTHAGLPRGAALVLSALLADEDGRMTSAELTAALEVSSASVSGAVNYLLGLGMIRRERERGSRRQVYVMEDDSWHTAMTRTDQLYAPIIAALTDGLDTMGADHPARRRLLLTREFLTFVEGEMAMLIERWREHRDALADES